MISHVNTFGLSGIHGLFIDAEIHIAKGLPDFCIIGMGNTAVKEAGERIRAAIENTGFEMPLGRITVNLAPAGIRKEGAYFDLAIAAGIFCCMGILSGAQIREYGFIGELSLDGSIRPVRGVLSMVQAACAAGLHKCIVPVENANEAAAVDACEIFPAMDLPEVVQLFQEPRVRWRAASGFYLPERHYADFSDVKGQRGAVRAVEIAASGGHNILLLGAPGCGKTMIANRIPGILPDFTVEDSLAVTPVYSVLGKMDERGGLLRETPFRTIYPDITKAGLIGGGKPPMPGEISLAHKGVLFLDELAEFNRSVIQSLRQPMESGRILISRAGESAEFPAEFLLVAASNPCRCGKMLERNGKCSCTPLQIRQYLSRISRPLLDRIDIHFPMRSVNFSKYLKERSDSTEEIRKRVLLVREFQKDRYRKESVQLNGRLGSRLVRKYCKIDEACQFLIRAAVDKMGISIRGYEKLLKLARTIADMEFRERITEADVAEAIQYRFLDTLLEEAA